MRPGIARTSVGNQSNSLGGTGIAVGPFKCPEKCNAPWRLMHLRLETRSTQE
jgi:hypothetical protein